MTIKTIEISQSIEGADMLTGLKRWKKIGMSAELSDGEDEQEAVKSLEKKISIALGLPDLNGERPELPPERLKELHKDYGQPQIIYRDWPATNAKTALITDMNNCKSIPELETYKTLSSSNPELNEAYKRKYSELLSA